MFRIVFSNLLGEGTKIFSIVKGAIIYFCLAAAFPMILDTLFSIPESYLPKMSTLSAISGDSSEWSSSSLIPYAVDRVLEVLLAGLYWIAYYLHIFFMIVMCSMAPIVFLSSTLLGLGLGLEIFLGLLIAGSSWPIIWYGFDQVHSHLTSAQTDEFGAKCLELLLTIFKGIAPVAFASIAIKSPPGKAITSAAQLSIGSGKWLSAKVLPQSFSSRAKMQSHPQMQTSQKNFRSRSPALEAQSISSTPESNRLKKANLQKENSENKKMIKKTNEVLTNENSRTRNI